jgi:hypothetical protein
MSADNDMRKRWKAAKDEKEKAEVLFATSKNALGDLCRSIDEAVYELARLPEEYARLSLSRGFSAPLDKATRLLEQRCKRMEEEMVSLEQLAQFRSRLKQMKGRWTFSDRPRRCTREFVRLRRKSS